MKKKLTIQERIERHIRHRAALEKIFYIISFFVAPFVFYIAARHKYLFDDVDDDEDLQLYLDAERRYAIVTIIWLLSIIAILLLIVVVKI